MVPRPYRASRVSTIPLSLPTWTLTGVSPVGPSRVRPSTHSLPHPDCPPGAAPPATLQAGAARRTVQLQSQRRTRALYRRYSSPNSPSRYRSSGATLAWNMVRSPPHRQHDACGDQGPAEDVADPPPQGETPRLPQEMDQQACQHGWKVEERRWRDGAGVIVAHGSLPLHAAAEPPLAVESHIGCR